MPVHLPERDCVRSASRSTSSISEALRLGLRPQPRSTLFATRKTGAGQDFTGLTAAVQLRLRVASGLQTLTVKSRLLTGENSVRIRGNPPFPHPW